MYSHLLAVFGYVSGLLVEGLNVTYAINLLFYAYKITSMLTAPRALEPCEKG